MENQILVYGYGNPGRQDDGLGVEMINKLEEWKETQQLDHITLDLNFQLNIEDATEMEGNDIVIFVDASLEELDNGFTCSRVEPSSKAEFSMHSVSPGYILGLCQNLYNYQPETYLIHIKGYEWNLEEDLTAGAQENLEKARHFLQDALLHPERLREAIQQPTSFSNEKQ